GTLTASGAGQMATFNFQAPAGRVVYLNNQGVPGSTLNWTLTGPASTTVFNFATDSDIGAYSLPRSGTYTFTLLNNSGASRNFQSNFLDLDLAGANAYTLGTSVSSSFANANSAVAYRFSGSAGQKLLWDSFTTGASGFATLFGPGAYNAGQGFGLNNSD